MTSSLSRVSGKQKCFTCGIKIGARRLEYEGFDNGGKLLCNQCDNWLRERGELYLGVFTGNKEKHQYWMVEGGRVVNESGKEQYGVSFNFDEETVQVAGSEQTKWKIANTTG